MEAAIFIRATINIKTFGLLGISIWFFCVIMLSLQIRDFVLITFVGIHSLEKALFQKQTFPLSWIDF